MDPGNITDENIASLVRDYVNGNQMKYKQIGEWDVSNVTDMSRLFSHLDTFNEPLNDWDVSKVKNMEAMFYCCRKFDQPLNDWNVSSVTNMAAMFGQCDIFNQPLYNWNVSNVTNMQWMFDGCRNFNQSLVMWNVLNATDMRGMFHASKMEEKNYPSVDNYNKNISIPVLSECLARRGLPSDCAAYIANYLTEDPDAAYQATMTGYAAELDARLNPGNETVFGLKRELSDVRDEPPYKKPRKGGRTMRMRRHNKRKTRKSKKRRPTKRV